jgi:hypothetical protein
MEVIPRLGSVRSLKGMLGRPERPLSLDEIEQAIAEGAGE